MAGLAIPGYNPEAAGALEAERRRRRQTTATGTSGGEAGAAAAAQTAASGGPTSYQVDPYGSVVYQGTTGDPKTLAEQERLRLQALYGSQSMEQSAALQAQAEQRRLGYLSQLQAAGGAGVSPVQYGGAGGADGTAARDAIFARAKDKAGQIARASLNALRNVMGERGLSGSSIEGLQQAGVVGAAGSELGDVNREQMIQDLNRQAEIQDLVYQGGIAQRGQTLAANRPESLLGLITARGLY